MSIKDDTHTNFSPGPKDALPSESNAELPQHDYPGTLRTPKKMRLESVNLSGTTSAVLQAIRKKRTEDVLDEQVAPHQLVNEAAALAAATTSARTYLGGRPLGRFG